MLPDQQLLRIPGPTPIPPSVQRAMLHPMIGHRDQETKELLRKIKPKLKKVFETKEEIAILAGSGTAGLEAAVTNCTQPGDEVLVIVTGVFGERFAKICEAYQLNVHRIDVTWGKAVDTLDVENFLKGHPSIKAVFVTYCETSTGVLNPIQELSNIIHTNSDALFIVDGVSAVGGVQTKMDEWGLDLVVTGSQKALMLPPGLTFVAASKRAWEVIEKNNIPTFYLDLQKYRENILSDSTPFTPSISLLFGLNQVLDMFEKEGLENVYERHQLMKLMTREAFKAWNIPLLTRDSCASPTVTSVIPNDFNPDALRKTVKNDFNLVLAGGQQELKGKIFRIGHMGYCSPSDILQTISLIEIGLVKTGKNVMLGSGIAAAQKILTKEVK
ncbi:pyridoxal-phosphate-dependent aminotransferase family protein [Ornithinibacillus halophilus]|uniref:Aspartate aminotransferase n=1 Tax=Ornithinibacillus halophilus TaxID=930117 RepID=A0A1M5HT56_9BACI|nr:alanine--glyoxylate aminotransferase family protein [Ornithinibacillus halophilus]SHG19149.1 aspartate aminotransferase [Ornithinibacillus halophilus]